MAIAADAPAESAPAESAPAGSAPAAPTAKGRIGVQLEAVGVGMLAASVVPGSGAQKAGLRAGDVIIAVEGVPVAEGVEGARQQLMGPSGSKVKVTVRRPLGRGEEALEIERGVAPAAVKAAPLPAPVLHFRTTLIRGNKGEVKAATEALVASKFGGMRPGAAVGSVLRSTMARDPKALGPVVDRLRPLAAEDPELALLLADACDKLDRAPDALALRRLALAKSPPDLWFADGKSTADLGGNDRTRIHIAEADWEAGAKEAAIEGLRRLSLSRNIGPLAATVGLVPEAPQEPWRASIPALAELSLTLTDGSPWRLSEHKGRVVLLTFWATWCGPCRQELPELVKLRDELGPQGFDVVALSIDQGKTVADIPATVSRLGVDFPVSHSPSVANRFGVSAIPALRLIGRDGTLVYSAKGYSADALRRLREATVQALKDDGQSGGVLGRPHGVADARLLSFEAVPGGTGLAIGDGVQAVGVSGASPWVRGPEGISVPDVSEGTGSPDERLAWLDGPVALDPGRHLLRAWDPEGGSRWTVNLPSPGVDLAILGDRLLVASEAALYLLDGDGVLVQEVPISMIDLARAEGGVWAVDGRSRWWIQPVEGAMTVEERGRRPGGARVAEGGEVAGALASDLLSGHFGPGGALRVVATRADRRLIGLSGEGEPAFSLELREDARLGAVDIDKDGQDELVAVIRGVGVATIHLRLP